jgi:hypothetical protein
MIAFKVFGLHKKGCYRAAILMFNKMFTLAVADVYNAHHLTSFDWPMA